MILLIDNYDSFVYNLARYISELGFEKKVVRNNAITRTEIDRLKPSHIIISPGPCTPNEAGVSLDVIQQFGEKIPILGVCLGHQAIGQAYGGKVVRALRPVHGQSSFITHDRQGIFQGLNNPLQVARYHSLIVSHDDLPPELIATAYCEQGEIMALRHRHYPVYGVQFHPESILTEQGHALLKNFLCVIPAYAGE
jgi:anthranilate synthase/aminodeoxychorismate synthase-like glutamine amidotransferase